VAKGAGAKLLVWTRTEGLGDGRKETMDPVTVLREIASRHEPGLYLLKIFMPFLTIPLSIRALRSALRLCADSSAPWSSSARCCRFPREIEKDVHVLNIPLPRPPRSTLFWVRF